MEADKYSGSMKKRKRSKGPGTSKILLSSSTQADGPKLGLAVGQSSPAASALVASASKSESGGIGLFAFCLVALLFFASGFSSLIYQVVWTRMLVLVFGATTFATSTVLAIFMGGLALGSFAAGRVSDRVRRPLLWYGVLEAIIGIWALLTPLLFTAATPVYKLIWLHTHASVLPFSLLRFVCTGLILIVPTTCMGATLPLLSRYVADELNTIGSRVGTLYSTNTLGAVAGALVTGFVILPMYGISASIAIGAAINFFLLFAVLTANFYRNLSPNFAQQPATAAKSAAPPQKQKTSEQKMSKQEKTTSRQELKKYAQEQTTSEQKQNTSAADPSGGTESGALPFAIRLAIVTFACSGAIAMIYEVCWTRTLLMVIGSSTYAFTVMLSAFLIGIFLGSLICARFIDRTSRPFVWFGVLQLLIGLFTLVSMHEFNYLPFWNLFVTARLRLDTNAVMLLRFALAGSILVPTTLCLGAIFPVVVKGCVQNLSRVGRSVGDLYSANTVGAIIGAFMTGFVCLPLFGVEKTLIGAGLINIALGLILLWTSTQISRRPKVIATIFSAPLIIVFLQSPDIWDKKILLDVQSWRRNILMRGFSFASFEQWRKHVDAMSVTKFWFDGPCSNVGVSYRKRDNVTSLVTNGHVDASDDVDMPVQALVSGFPLLLKPDAKDIAVIGWGCGQTVGTATLFPLRSIEAIELEPAVIEASKYFHHLNHWPEKDKRVHIQYNDGRNYLLATDEKFDVIVSEPSNPWQSGVCNLFTREYFEICHKRLRANGILSVWVQTAEVPPKDLRGVLAGITETFPYTLAFAPRPGNIVVLGSDAPLTVDMQSVREQLQDKTRKNEFTKVGVPTPESLAAHILVSSQGLKRIVGSSYINSDDRNRLEFDVGRSYEDKLYVAKNHVLLELGTGDPWDQVSWGKMDDAAKAESLAAISSEALNSGGDVRALGWAKQSIAAKPNALAFKLMGRALAAEQHYSDAEQAFSKALAMTPDDLDLLMLRGSVRVAMRDRKNGIKDLQKALAGDETNKVNRYLLAGSYTPDLFQPPDQQGQCAKKVLEVLGNLIDDQKFANVWPHTYRLAGQSYFVLGEDEKAKHYIKTYLRLVPNDQGAISLQKILNSR